MSEDTTNLGTHEDITIKKSTYNNMIKGLVAAIAIATFVGGYTLGTMDSSSLSGEDLKEIISEINSNIWYQFLDNQMSKLGGVYDFSDTADYARMEAGHRFIVRLNPGDE